jgi:hypothetical protein
MSTRGLTPRLSALAVETRALNSTPQDYWDLTRITAPQGPHLPLSRVGHGKGAIAKAPYARALGWSVVVADPQRGWTSLAGRLGGTPVNLVGYPYPIDVLLGSRS